MKRNNSFNAGVNMTAAVRLIRSASVTLDTGYDILYLVYYFIHGKQSLFYDCSLGFVFFHIFPISFHIFSIIYFTGESTARQASGYIRIKHGDKRARFVRVFRSMGRSRRMPTRVRPSGIFPFISYDTSILNMGWFEFCIYILMIKSLLYCRLVVPVASDLVCNPFFLF